MNYKAWGGRSSYEQIFFEKDDILLYSSKQNIMQANEETVCYKLTHFLLSNKNLSGKFLLIDPANLSVKDVEK